MLSSIRLVFAPGSSSVLRSSFSVPLAFSSEVKGWRLMIADARTPFPPDPGGRGASSREKGIPASAEQKHRDPRKKTGRSIRRQARNSPAKKSSNRFPSLYKRTGASPSCLKSISRPLPSILSLPFRSSEADAAALVGRVTAPFIQRRSHHAIVLKTCKEIRVVWSSMVNRKKRRRLSRWRGFVPIASGALMSIHDDKRLFAVSARGQGSVGL